MSSGMWTVCLVARKTHKVSAAVWLRLSTYDIAAGATAVSADIFKVNLKD